MLSWRAASYGLETYRDPLRRRKWYTAFRVTVRCLDPKHNGRPVLAVLGPADMRRLAKDVQIHAQRQARRRAARTRREL